MDRTDAGRKAPRRTPGATEPAGGSFRGRVRRTAPTAALLALLACWAACAPGLDDLRPVLDLVEALPAAEVHREAATLDLGTRAARNHLLDGWSWDEEDADGTRFVWGVGAASRLRLFLAEPRRLRLELRGRPMTAPGNGVAGRAQTVRVRANGADVARLELASAGGWTGHRLEVPAETLRSGWNVVELAYAWAVSPREAGLSDDRRRLAAAWERVRVEPAAAGPAGPAATRGPEGEAGLRLPAGSEVAYYLHVEPGSVLALDRIESEGGPLPGGTGGTRLVVEARAEGAEPREIGRLGPSRRRRALRLHSGAGDGPELIRLALRAVPAGWPEPGAEAGAPGGGFLDLAAPRVLAPEGPAPGAGGAPAPAAQGASEPARPAGPASEPTRRPHVLVYMVDTLRADRVGAYGGPGRARGLTPEADAFATEATVFASARTQAPWTRPVVASLFTGRGPLAHGVTGLDARLPDEAVTLAEVLRESGYRTAAWSTNWHVTRETGLAQGFDDFHFFPEGPGADVVNRSVARWLDRELGPGETGGRDGRDEPARAGPSGPEPTEPEPFFLYVHALDPHAPYRPPEDLRRRFAPDVTNQRAGTLEHLHRAYAASGRERTRLVAELLPLYDAETAFADRCFGELLDLLSVRGLRDDTLVVFLSDHGEEFDEHGDLGHGNNLYEESLRIPLIVDPPGDPPRERPGPAAAGLAPSRAPALPVDVPATILAALGLDGLPDMEGTDLLGSPPGGDRPSFAHLDYGGRRGVAVVLGDWKLIVPRSGAMGRSPELYHLGRDPGEREDLATRRPVRAGYLESLVRLRLLEVDGGAPAEPLEASPELREGLKALGYL